MSSRCTPTSTRLQAWRRAAALLLAAAALLLPRAAPAQSIESVLAPGAVIQGHAKVETDCKSCHARFDRAAQDGLCIACHKQVGADIRAHQGFHGRHQPQGQACRSCHLEHRGRKAAIAAFDHKTFDHRQTEFELHDKHLGVDCAKCHRPGKRWRAAPTACVECHAKDDVHHGGLGRRCETCHSAKGWKSAAFDHDRQTHFPLTGRHAQAKCDDCHVNGQFKDTPRTCIACHRKKDEHKGQFGAKCESCHSTQDWKLPTFQHDTDTHFRLLGQHRSVKCTACHTGLLYVQKLGTSCIDCHAKDDKHHGDLGRACADCHSERGWKEAPRFDHASTRFPLLGAHARVDCKDCHKDQQFRQTPDTCIGCHRKDDRHEGNLGERCNDCHDTTKWKPARGFDHQKTQFPLLDAHAAPQVRCVDCHETLHALRHTPTACVACHRSDDRHQGSLGEHCESCHRESGWKVAHFDHSKTLFPLLGAHLPLACKSCHLSPRYKEAPRACIGCHRKDDRHKQAFGTNCASCHNVRAWPLWTFDHDRQTHYRLEGRHRHAACAGCHAQPAPAGQPIAATSQACGACHLKDDAHDGRFGNRCEQCHDPNDWNEVRPGAAGRPLPPPPKGSN
ncbi:MAG: cytochrome C [Burkholderiales bacterium]|nr:cytochrome C [Burkholderiales bacterium]MDE1928892.1 cytochrome C [Burkholderiales bacterium]MDE2160329.1 cytochrome C [Burkholderiales bacterium]